jgi:CheY-like chemotaxis protein
MALRILLADDSVAAQNTGRKILASAGYEVTTVSNGMAAAKQIVELHPDLVLLDVYMPGYTGVEVCEKTKAAPETAQTPVLLTVGKMEPFPAAEGIKAKADGLLIKPFETKNLITQVEKLAAQRRPEQTAPQPPVLEMPRSHVTREAPTSARPSDPATPEKPHPSASSRQRGGEICDVCGFLNQEPAFACQQCDVPLPSSVKSIEAAASSARHS